jgi:GrpB-like predicted nucleotidyltransferase (UPF0157 family)
MSPTIMDPLTEKDEVRSMSAPIVIVEYDPAWPQLFQTLRHQVAGVLGDLVLRIEHVGSTAVPGLASKPIIDLDVVVRSVADSPAAIERLAALGYVHRGDRGIPGREAFTTPPDSPPHHLYVVAAGNPAYRRHLLFRDYLRRHPEAAQAYAAFKQAAAERFRDDRTAYTDAKDAIVQDMVKRAEEEEDSRRP